jgi:hypothetical protein
MAKYTMKRVSLAEYQNTQSCIVTFYSGNPPEDSTLPVPWPYTLPDGWSVEWNPSPANTDPTE